MLSTCLCVRRLPGSLCPEHYVTRVRLVTRGKIETPGNTSGLAAITSHDIAVSGNLIQILIQKLKIKKKANYETRIYKGGKQAAKRT